MHIKNIIFSTLIFALLNMTIYGMENILIDSFKKTNKKLNQLTKQNFNHDEIHQIELAMDESIYAIQKIPGNNASRSELIKEYNKIQKKIVSYYRSKGQTQFNFR
jgi:ribonuclease HIII